MLQYLTHPLVLAGSGVAWLLFGRKKPVKLAAGEFVVTLDQGLSEADAHKILQQLLYCTDCNTLDASAQQLSSLGYPLSAQELRSRSAQVRAAMPKPVSPCAGFDPSLDSATCASVMNALQTGKNPADLVAFAASIAGRYPRAAQVLRAQAAVLQASMPAATPASPVDAAAAVTENIATDVAEAAITAGKIPGVTAAPQGNSRHVIAEQEQTGQEQVSGKIGIAPIPVGNSLHVVPEQEQTGATGPSAYVLIRASDKVKPDSLAKIGSGQKTVTSQLELVALNPEMRSSDGMIREFLPGQKVRIPGEWVERLKQRGFAVETP